MSKRKIARLERAARVAKLDQIEAELRELQQSPPSLEILSEFKEWMPPQIFSELFGDAYQQLGGR
jgi:hypothetical protein